MSDNYARKQELMVRSKQHTERMAHMYPEEIDKAIRFTRLYADDILQKETPFLELRGRQSMFVMGYDTVTAIFAARNYGRCAALNFASYKEPGGKFLEGSQAQEECLCHESFLYNILKEKQDYYQWNKDHLAKGLYQNRALYTPSVLFQRGDCIVPCDVITCAAPNRTNATRYGKVTEEENQKALEERIHFLARIADQEQVRTIILGAYGCGVFGQNAEMVAESMKKHFSQTGIINVVFAVPKNIDTINYQAFKKVIG